MLKTTEEALRALAVRLAHLEIKLTRCFSYAESSERLQDSVNERVAARLKALEDKTSSL